MRAKEYLIYYVPETCENQFVNEATATKPVTARHSKDCSTDILSKRKTLQNHGDAHRFDMRPHGFFADGLTF